MVLNNKKQVFGVVDEHPEKEDYVGIDSQSAKVTVDNLDRTIRVDVNTSAILGTTSNTAYPGHLGADTRRIALSFDHRIADEVTRATEAEAALDKKYRDITTTLAGVDSELDKKITQMSNQASEELKLVSDEVSVIKDTYADKTYVYEQLVEFAKLSKQLIDDVDLETNKVIVDGNLIDPQDGILYLVKDDTVVGNDIYREYTLIEDVLVLIGDTTLDLKGYAKLEDIPNVSEFISEIPEEYITEDELEEELAEYKSFMDEFLNEIRFVDGGNASSIKALIN